MSSELRLHIDEQTVLVRRANAAELIDLRHRVLRAGLPISEASFASDELATNYHFGAFTNPQTSTAICCATFHLNRFENSPAWQLRGMATDPAWTSKGLGKAVLNLAIQTICDASPVQTFWCNARVAAIPFYEKQGWKIVSERFEIPTAGPHHRMLLIPTR
jgi:GNAT superfamily N-acetyltransferase